MPILSPGHRANIESAYNAAVTLLDRLNKANEKRDSAARRMAADELTAHQRQIESLGLFEKEDFTDEEQNALLDAAGEIMQTVNDVNDAHEITLMEIESDLAQAVQKLSLREYLGILKGYWVRESRLRNLPGEITDELRDLFTVGVFMRVQGSLNQSAARIREIKPTGCLNGDDYETDLFFPRIVMPATEHSAQAATEDYSEMLRLKRAAEAEKEADRLGIGGMIWSVIGWDSPSEFFKDVVVTVATGGAGKVIKWVKKLDHARKRVRGTARGLSRILNIEQKVQKMERRINEIRNAAEKIRKLARKVAAIPANIIAAFKKLEQAEEQLKLTKRIGDQVTAQLLRNIVSTLSGRFALGRDPRIGGVISNEVARQAVMAATSGWWISKKIEELEGQVNFKDLTDDNFLESEREKFFYYLGLVTLREWMVRLGLSVVRKFKFSMEMVINEFIAAFGSALETVFNRLPVVIEENLGWLPQTVVSTIRKVLVALAQKLTKPLSHVLEIG